MIHDNNTLSRGCVASTHASRLLRIFELANELRGPVNRRLLPHNRAEAAVFNAVFSAADAGELNADPLYIATLAMRLLDYPEARS